MTRDKVINSLTLELVTITGDDEHMSIIRKYIGMTLDIGINHFTKDMEEVIAMDEWGNEIGRFKGVTDAAVKLGLKQYSISDVIAGRQHSTGGYLFAKAHKTQLITQKS